MNTPPRFLQHLIGLECEDAYHGIEEVYVIVDVIPPRASTEGTDPGGPIDVVIYDSERQFHKKCISQIVLTPSAEEELFCRIGAKRSNRRGPIHINAGRL
jgi:hypothetical protein